MDKNFEKIIKRLVEYLNYYCSSKGNLHISEDTLRYFFFAAVLDLYGVEKVTKCEKRKSCCESNICKEVLVNIEQELSLKDSRLEIEEEYLRKNTNRKNKNNELDTYLKIDKNNYAVEFKKHYKKVNNKDSGGHPQFIGLLINDFKRLQKMNANNLQKYQITLVDYNLINDYEMKSSKIGNRYKEEILDKDNVTSKKNNVININENELKEECEALRKNGKKEHSAFEKGLTNTFDLSDNNYEVRINNKINIRDQYVLFVYKLSNN